MKSKNRADYVSAWRDHIAQPIYPALDANVPMSEYEEVRATLRGWIEKAADNNHPAEAKSKDCTECGKPAEGNYSWTEGGELCDECEAAGQTCGATIGLGAECHRPAGHDGHHEP